MGREMLLGHEEATGATVARLLDGPSSQDYEIDCGPVRVHGLGTGRGRGHDHLAPVPCQIRGAGRELQEERGLFREALLSWQMIGVVQQYCWAMPYAVAFAREDQLVEACLIHCAEQVQRACRLSPQASSWEHWASQTCSATELSAVVTAVPCMSYPVPCCRKRE